MLQSEEVIKLIKEGVSERVKDAREYSDLLNMHVTGKGIKQYTEEFNNHESEEQRKVRERLIKSNKSTFSFLLRPTDKVFTAKGGSISYNLPERQLEFIKEVLSDIGDGLDIKTFLKKKAKLNYIINPNGFVMVDVSEDGGLETKIFTEHDVIWYDKKGNQVQAIIFNPYESDDENDKKEYYRVIDEKTDSIYIKDGEEVYLDEDTVLDNFFGYVPAYVLGDIYCPNKDLFLSLIDEVLEDAKEHLRDVSVNVVHKLSHGFAKYWSYPEACTTCGGDGVIKSEVNGEIEEHVCHTCKGSGIKNTKSASDMMLVDFPMDGEQKLAPDVAGYINPSIEIWKQYKEDIQDIKFSMFQTLWGTTFTTESKNETATGRLLNVQPEAERVSGISVTFSNIHEFILDCYGKAIFQNKNYKSSVTYGTRYLMESPDQVLQRYMDSKKEGLPAIVQQDLLDKFYQTEYATNNPEYQKIKKILAVDPFPSMTALEVKEVGITGIDYNMKIFYPQWSNQLSEAKRILMSEEELKKDLKEFTLIKMKENVTKEVQQRTEKPT